MAKNRIRLGYGIHRVCSRLGIVRPPREISTPVGPGRSITVFTLYPRPREIMVRAVEGHHRNVQVLKHTARLRTGGLLRAPTIFTPPKIVLPLPLDQRDTVLIPPITDPARVEVASLVHPLQANVPLAKLTLGPIGPARSLPLRGRYRHIQHLRRQSPIVVLLLHNKTCSCKNPRHSHPGENSSQPSHQVSSARRRITNSLVVVRTSYLPVTTLVRRPLRVTPRHLHADHLFPTP
jgi:hypothetical protein